MKIQAPISRCHRVISGNELHELLHDPKTQLYIEYNIFGTQVGEEHCLDIRVDDESRDSLIKAFINNEKLACSKLKALLIKDSDPAELLLIPLIPAK